MKKPLIQKLLSFILCFIMIFANTSFQLLANTENYEIKIIEDSDEYRIAESRDEKNIYITTFDKINETVQFQIQSIQTGEVNIGEETDINSVILDKNNDMQKNKRSTNQYQNTYSNYEYTKTYGNPNQWELRAGTSWVSWEYYQIKETSQNSSSLEKYRNIIENINGLEITIIIECGLANLSFVVAAASGAGALFTGGVLTTAAWGSIVAAAGMSSRYINTLMTYDRACRDAYDLYNSIYYKYY